MQRGKVWWVDFDPARNGEIQKKRPAVIVSNNLSNAHLNQLSVVPVMYNTSRIFPSQTFVIVCGHSSKAMADQFITLAKGHLGTQLAAITRPDLKAVEHVLKIQLGLPL